MNIGEANDVVRVLRAHEAVRDYTGRTAAPGTDLAQLEQAEDRLIERAAKALNVSPATIRREITAEGRQ